MLQNCIGYCRAVFDYAAIAPNQLSLKDGDRIAIISKGTEGQGWWKGRNGSQVVNALYRLTFTIRERGVVIFEVASVCTTVSHLSLNFFV